MDLRERVLAKYLEGAVLDKTAAGPPPLGNDEPPGGDPGTNPVMAASGLPGGDGGGPGKRNIPKDHPYDPRALKPLSRMLWAMSVALGHGLTAYRQFAKLKSATISPDGMLGGRGYVMQVKEIRDKLHNACENLSSISDTIHDEINAPHWEPKMDQLDPDEALDVRKFIQESQQILQNPEEDAEDEMEAIEDASPEELGQEDAALEDEAAVDDAAEADTVDEEGVETPPVDPEQEEAFLNDQEGAEAESPEETEEADPLAPGEEESYSREEDSEEVPADDESDEAPVDEEEVAEDPSEEAPAEEEVEEAEEESYSRDDTTDDEEEDAPLDGGDDEVAPADEDSEEVAPSDEGESYSRQDEGEEEESDEEAQTEETPEDEETVEDDEITPEDEALADKAWESSGLPGAEEPRPEPLQPPKKKKKRKKFSPAEMPPAATVQDQKFAPDQSQRLAYDRTANSSLPVDSLPGPRVDHIDRAEGEGPFGSYNEEEPRIDGWSLNDGRPESDDGKYVDRLASDIESWWDGLPQEDRTVTATSLQLRTANRVQWTSEDWEKVFAHQAGSALPEDLDTPTDGWDLGLGYGAKGDGAGGYENPSGEGNGYQGVFGPTSGLPKDSTGLMPTDVMPPVARSDYYTDGITDEDVPEGLYPEDPDLLAQAELPGEPELPQPPSHYYFSQSELPGGTTDYPYTYDRDLMNTGEAFEQLNTPYAEKPRSPAR